MGQTLNHDGSITVIAYSLPEFAFEICELAAKGFTVTYENNKVPSGGFGSYYTAILVPRHHYRIDVNGNHVNVPETSTETTPNDDSSDINPDVVVSNIKQTTTAPKTARSTTKKTV